MRMSWQRFGRQMRPGFLKILLFLCGFVFALPASAACSVNAQGLNFGSYDVFSSQDLDSVGSLALSCDLNTSYSIDLGSGSGSYLNRTLLDSGNRALAYNLYIDASRSVIWGDGSSGTSTVAGTASEAESTHYIYGRIPAEQNLRAGAYQDTVVVTVNF